MNKFYTYCIIDPRDCQPFYVGKGTGHRMYDHWKHRNAKRMTNMRLKYRLLELDKLHIKPVYVQVLVNVTSTEALAKEIELIASYGRLDIGTGCLCNLTEGGDGVSEVGEETKHKWRQSYNSTPRGLPVSQYSLEGELIATYPSAKRASEAVSSANRSYITQCCKQKRQSAGGFLWTYTNSPAPTYTHAYNTRVEQRTKTGELVTVHRSVSIAAEQAGTSPQAISSACRGKSKTCAGYVWRYV